MYELATLYKYGKGCNLSYKKALKWYRKSAKLGNQKASYSIGYMFYKGLGTTEQNYTKAVKWFEKSSDPMAYYWLGVSYLKGHGVTQNLEKAIQYLNENSGVSYSETKDFISNQTNISNQTTDNNSQNDTTNFSEVVINKNFTPQELVGKWKGKLLLLDWSATHTEQQISITLEITYNTDDQTIKTTWSVNNNLVIDTALYNDKTIYNDQLYITLPNIAFNAKIAKELEYQILSSTFELKTVNNKTYLTALVESTINDWKEPGTPIQLVLEREGILSDNNQEIPEEILQALSNQKSSFIKLYPNPFVSDLIIAYTLEKESYTQLKITNFTTSKTTVIEQGNNQKKGEHRYFFDGRSLEKGMYIVTITVDGIQKTKLILKK